MLCKYCKDFDYNAIVAADQVAYDKLVLVDPLEGGCPDYATVGDLEASAMQDVSSAIQ